ncbi:CHAP domain-containing protein [Saccharibacillus sp. JS10]|uniref:CHAP domain-containing protein n=1 Tax=Saccharibacillus sp. JS10 TaxID=2950552 RepID=UPI0021092A3F|nr:CHAP domain-containing protein [Saccharibacillus sp. JS10]MCQ4088436.1 CHAP domain-containing protein [Saccharibacillus sp. JS10]
MTILQSRLESIRTFIKETICTTDNSALKNQEATVRLYGVSSLASMIAMKRGLEPEIAAIAGLLHCFYNYKTGIHHYPGINSAEAVRPILRDFGVFSTEEQLIILRAIFYQDQRRQTHGPYDELIKDAIVLHNFLQNTEQAVVHLDAKRLSRLLDEFAIQADFVEGKIERSDASSDVENRRQLLADISEDLAGKKIIGIPEDKRYREICQYWPDSEIYQVLQNNWCAAFVYHCCMVAGFILPIRYPNASYRLAGVGAILEWAKLPETGFFHLENEEGFMPERGDIVVYNKLLSDHPHDHIGIVLSCEEHEILVAEGNRDNENYSSILRRNKKDCILGYIRIDNEYRFNFDGVYNPIL